MKTIDQEYFRQFPFMKEERTDYFREISSLAYRAKNHTVPSFDSVKQ